MFGKFAQAMHHYRFAKYTSACNPRAKVTRANIQGLAANLTTLVRQCKSDVPPPGLMLFNFDDAVDKLRSTQCMLPGQQHSIDTCCESQAHTFST